MSLGLAVFAARLGDLICEAREEMTEAEFEDWLVIAAASIANNVSGQLESRWMDGR